MDLVKSPKSTEGDFWIQSPKSKYSTSNNAKNIVYSLQGVVQEDLDRIELQNSLLFLWNSFYR